MKGDLYEFKITCELRNPDDIDWLLAMLVERLRVNGAEHIGYGAERLRVGERDG